MLSQRQPFECEFATVLYRPFLVTDGERDSLDVHKIWEVLVLAPVVQSLGGNGAREMRQLLMIFMPLLHFKSSVFPHTLHNRLCEQKERGNSIKIKIVSCIVVSVAISLWDV